MIYDLGDLVGEVIGSEVGGGLRRFLRERRARRLRLRGKAQVSVRVVRGTVDGLRTRWRTADWEVRPGALVGRKAVVRTDEIALGHRVPTFRESWVIDPGARIHAATVGAATVEIAVAESQAHWVFTTLDTGAPGGSSGSAGSAGVDTPDHGSDVTTRTGTTRRERREREHRARSRPRRVPWWPRGSTADEV
jgi:hypothetical protein